MNLKAIRYFSICVLITFCTNISAQDNYHAEIGITGGGAYYLGDANSQLFNNSTLTYGALLRYKLNPRIAFRAEWNRTKVVWTENFVGNNINALDICGEFNFFDLEKNEYKRESRTFSPYIFAGIGVANYSYLNNSIYTPTVPFGVGIKVRLNAKWNLNAQWSNRLLMSDKLEGIALLNNPNNLNGTNFLNNDLLSTATIGFSYNFWKKKCDCLRTANK
jgi:hypothetical protein